MKRQLILILYIALLLSCNRNYSNQPNGMGGGFTCQPGPHDSDIDGIRNFNLECYGNGNRKKQTYYFYSKVGPLKIQERTYYESNENNKTYIKYYSDGAKYIEATYYETGKLKTNIRYRTDGVSFDTGYPICYDTDGITAETCSLDKHGISI